MSADHMRVLSIRQSSKTNDRLVKSLLHKSIPFVFGALFLVSVTWGIRNKAYTAIAPPIYDPIAYYHKSRVVWDALSKGNFAGTLNGVKANRPPGTALLLYPFGFSNSVRSFLFRSALLPIVLWTLALVISVAVVVHRLSDAIVGGCLAVGLGTMPLFYHFEYSDAFAHLYQITNQWGLVDPLQGAVAALAVCLLMVGIEKGLLSLCIIGWLMSALSFFIKPSGALVMAATLGIAAIELLIRYLRYPEQRRKTLKFAAWVFLGCVPIFGLAFWLAFGSDYLSKEMVLAGIKATSILRLISEGQDLTAVFMRFIVPVIGWWWFCPMAFCLMLLAIEALTSMLRRQFIPISLRLVGSVVLASLAICWWLFLAGTEHRYLFPFILMIIMWLAPSIFERMKGAGITMKSAIACYSLLPAFVLLGLLYSAHPSMSLQTAMGINLSTGQFAFEVNVGQQLLAEAGKLGRPINIYSIGNTRVGVVEMMDRVKTIESGNYLGEFNIKRPLNWKDVPGLKLQEIVDSDYLMIEDVRPASTSTAASIADWREELEQFKQHVYYGHNVEKNGLELLHDGPVKVLRVVDKERLADELHAWAKSIRWENDFADRNRTFLSERQ